MNIDITSYCEWFELKLYFILVAQVSLKLTTIPMKNHKRYICVSGII